MTVEKNSTVIHNAYLKNNANHERQIVENEHGQ